MKKKYVNLFTAATAFTIVATTVAPGVTNAAYFSDIQGNTHEQAIIQLVNKNLIYGYADGTFRPNQVLTQSDVVKLVGRYLVQNGYKIPADYRTNMRYSDLSPYYDDELLQYAALLRDNQIFISPDGRLQPNLPMTRENMAIVLVNTLTTIYKFDYRTYVSGKNYYRKVKDLYVASPNARSSIDVLDYYNVTVVNQFRPFDNLTRGQFASFLYRLMYVPKEEWLNVASTEVTKNQIKIKFTERVNLQSTNDPTVLAKNFVLKNVDTNKEIPLIKGELSADGLTYTLSVKDDFNGKYVLEANELVSVNGKTMKKFTLEINAQYKEVKEQKRVS